MIHQSIIDQLLPVTPEEQAILDGQETIDRKLYMDGSKNQIISRKLLERGKLITVRPHTRFIHFPEHTHDFVEMVYMCQGTTTHIVNGTRIVLQAGELLLMGQNTKQEICRAGHDDLAVNFIILPEFFQDTIPYLGENETPLNRFLVNCLCHGQDDQFLHFRVADVLPIQHLVENLLWNFLSDTQNRREINQMTIALLFMQLINHTDRLCYTSQEQEAVFQVLRYIEGNYVNGSLNEIADRLHYNSSRLSREIKHRTGKNFIELMQDKRLSQAVWLLKNTNMRISDIAVSVGYENISYFHRIFAAQFGTSPKKYRGCK